MPKLNLKSKTEKKTSLRDRLKGKRKQISEKKENNRVCFLDTGSIVLNLALSQKGKNGGWARGRVINPVGDGSSGKTLLVLEAFFQAFITFKNCGDVPSNGVFPPVKKLIMVYDNIEGVMDMPLEEMYGEDFVKAVEWIKSETCEEFGRSVQRRIDDLKPGECLLYAGDSLDAMVSSAQIKRNEESLKKDKDEEAAYGTEKAKYFSGGFFNNLCKKQEGKDATLFCVSQLRENIGVSFGEKYKRTGGKALDFYTHQVPWLRKKDDLKKTFRGQEKTFGVRVHVKVKRNKCAKPFREAEFCILFDYGLDNIGSMMDYIFGPKVKSIDWNGKKYESKEFISLIENSEKDYDKLVHMVEKDWSEIEAEVVPDRKKRF